MTDMRGNFRISIDGLNQVFPEENSGGLAIHIYGPPKVGKSILCYQLVYELVTGGYGNALYIDTEAAFTNAFQPVWVKRFKERFGKEITVEKVEVIKYARKRSDKREILKIFETVLNDLGISYSKMDLEKAIEIFLKKIEIKAPKQENAVYVIEENDIIRLLSFLGIEAELDMSKEKMEFKVKKVIDIDASPLSKFIKEHNIKVVVVDSIGMVIKRLRSDLASLPARAQALNHFIGGLTALTSHYSLVFIATNHESKAPQGFHSYFFGGSPVGYGFKFSFYMSSNKEVRKLTLVRSPYHKDRAVEIELTLDEQGFREIKQDD